MTHGYTAPLGIWTLKKDGFSRSAKAPDALPSLCVDGPYLRWAGRTRTQGFIVSSFRVSRPAGAFREGVNVAGGGCWLGTLQDFELDDSRVYGFAFV